MKNKIDNKNNFSIISTAGLLITAAVFVSPVIVSSVVRGQSVGDLRSQSAELEEKIEENNAHAERLEGEADTLKSKIGKLDNQIAKTNEQISSTTEKIETLGDELKKTRKELKRQKALLKANILALYKRGDASEVELIASSDNFSEYIDEQTYLERIKTGIQESAQKVIELEEKIKKKQDKQKELLEQQKAAKKSLDDTRGERARLLSVTEGKEAKYREVVARLKAKRAEVEEALSAKILAAQYANLGTANNGQIIGRVGMTGFTFGPHLHFELRDSNFKPINPGGFPLNNGLKWPVPSSSSIAQYFGCVPQNYYYTPCGGGSLHTGLDIAAPTGVPVVAAKPGVIIHNGDDGDGYGHKIVMKHSDGTYTLYAHLSW